MRPGLKRFLFPKLDFLFFARATLVALCAYLFFGHVCTPFVARGASMEPTFHNGTLHVIWKPRYWFSGPRRGDVVMATLAGAKVVYLKRVIALEGDTVEFQKGTLFLNGRAVDEPYVQGPCHWNLAPRLVEPGNVYLIGDNRSMPMEQHDFGQTSVRRVIGSPLW